MRPRRCRPAGRLAIVALLATLGLVPSCSSGGRLLPGHGLSVILKDFRIVASTSRIGAGEVRFDVHNDGPSTHEFVVLRTDFPSAGLPLGPDGLTVEEDAKGIQRVGEIQETQLGESGTLVVSLAPGRYVLFCNLEGHYLGGMQVALTVSR